MRTLTADEIEVRIGSIQEKGCSLLLYKDARVDMKILDEEYGETNWQRTHEVINDNLFCNIDIWDENKKQWIRKQDVGVESYTEKQKGEASDSFKRAGFNWGIGKELYTSPFIWIIAKKEEFYENNGKWATKTKFKVEEIEYQEKNISKLIIVDDKGEVRFRFPKGNVAKSDLPLQMGQIQQIDKLAKETKTDLSKICENYDVDLINLLSWNQGQEVIAILEQKKNKKVKKED